LYLVCFSPLFFANKYYPFLSFSFTPVVLLEKKLLIMLYASNDSITLVKWLKSIVNLCDKFISSTVVKFDLTPVLRSMDVQNSGSSWFLIH
jgi:hypothetical protein